MTANLLSTTNELKTGTRNNYSGKAITEIITNGFFTVDRKWTVKYWNKAAEKLLGVRSEDIVGKNLWEKFAGVISIEFYKVYQNAFLKNIPVHFEEYWGEMGTWFDVITYYCDDTLSVSFKNSYQPKNPVQELMALRELYRFVTEVTNDCLWEWNLQTKELFWIDGGHKRVFGYPITNALIPQSFWESRLHPDDKLRILTRLNKIIEEGSASIWEDEYRFQKADGDYIYVHDRGHIIYDAQKKASRMIGATQDISARKLAAILLKTGLTLKDDKRSVLIGKIKSEIIELIYYTEEPLAIKFSEFLSEKLEHDYTYLANVFSHAQGITIEKFFISHKIERVKELLEENQYTLTDIAYQMHYSSVSHLSSQFKRVTGLTPSYFKHLKSEKISPAEYV
ncbi:MAG: PAS domain-containing protein [Bacteroidia bacterium]|nr:PAS domain-containing protein [Bacteroidia bacterium]